jgi:adenylate cyclase
MATDKIKRKLTAILSADVKGYSRLMGEDEEWTLRTLNAYKEVMRRLVQQHRGRGRCGYECDVRNTGM